MTDAHSPEKRAVPLVAIISKIPILAEALVAALEPSATVEHFPAGAPDTAGLVRYLQPDALIADDDENLSELEAVAREQQFVLLAVDLPDRTLRLLDHDGHWIDPPDRDPSAEVIRNIILAHLVTRKKNE